MEYMTPNFTKDMVKTHKILIPNMAVTQFRLMQAALASEGYQTEVLGNCGSEVAQLGLKYVLNDTCYPALLVIGQFLDALNSGKYDLEHTALLITQTGGGCRALTTSGAGCVPRRSRPATAISRSIAELPPEKGSGSPLISLLRKVASIFGAVACWWHCAVVTHPYEDRRVTPTPYLKSGFHDPGLTG